MVYGAPIDTCDVYAIFMPKTPPHPYFILAIITLTLQYNVDRYSKNIFSLGMFLVKPNLHHAFDN